MTNRLVLLFLIVLHICSAQTLDNRSLTGKYFFRHLQLTVQGASTVQSSRTLSGTLTFDGNGAFSFTGTQVIGTAGPSSLAGNGIYSVQANGLVTLSNPQQTSIN